MFPVSPENQEPKIHLESHLERRAQVVWVQQCMVRLTLRLEWRQPHGQDGRDAIDLAAGEKGAVPY